MKREKSKRKARKGAAEWSPIYLLLVLIIAAILLLTFVKPLFRQTASAATETLQEAETLVKTASLAIKLFF